MDFVIQISGFPSSETLMVNIIYAYLMVATQLYNCGNIISASVLDKSKITEMCVVVTTEYVLGSH